MTPMGFLLITSLWLGRNFCDEEIKERFLFLKFFKRHFQKVSWPVIGYIVPLFTRATQRRSKYSELKVR